MKVEKFVGIAFNKRKELLVYGFVREIQEAYKTLQMPMEITEIIHLYQKLCDEWSKKYCNPFIEIDTLGCMVYSTSGADLTAYGTHVVSDGIYKWRIKIIQLTTFGASHPPYIGIIENDEKYITAYTNNINWEKYGYQLAARSGRLYGYVGVNSPKTSDYKCIWQENGDVLEMTLDLNKGTLSFMVNNVDYGPAFMQIKKTNYRFIMSLSGCAGSKFQFL